MMGDGYTLNNIHSLAAEGRPGIINTTKGKDIQTDFWGLMRKGFPYPQN
jgi:hypothetical protein